MALFRDIGGIRLTERNYVKKIMVTLLNIYYYKLFVFF